MESHKKKVLMTGTGLLASNIAFYKKHDWELFLISRSRSSTADGVTIIQSDLSNYNQLTELFLSINPDIVIHTAGLANVDACENNYEDAFLANVTLTKNIAAFCGINDIKLVHISTDHFSNQKLEISDETDIGLPVNVYAETKLLGDLAVTRLCPKAIIARTNFFGWGNSERTSFSDFIIGNLRQNKAITLFDDIFYTPLFIDELTDSIEELVNKNLTGVFNIVSNKKISKYQFGISTAEVFGLSKELIARGSFTEKTMVKRPFNMALCNKKLVSAIGSAYDFDFVKSLEKLKRSETYRTRTI